MIDSPDEQAGRIVKAIGTYFLTDELPALENPMEQAVLNVIFEKTVENEAKYAAACEMKRQGAMKRWHTEEE